VYLPPPIPPPPPIGAPDLVTFVYNSDVTTITKTGSGNPEGIFVAPDGGGFQLFTSPTNQDLNGYSLAVETPLPGGTLAQNGNLYDAGVTINHHYFSDDGLMLLLIEPNGTLKQHSLSIAYDLTSMSLVASVSLTTSGRGAFTCSPDGFRLFAISGGGGTSIKQYTMEAPWDITTLDDIADEKAHGLGTEAIGIYVAINGERFYLTTTAGIHEFIMPVPFQLASAGSVNYTLSFSLVVPAGLYITPAQDTMYVLEEQGSGGKVYSFSGDLTPV
jgi:hypothetical protein